MSTPPVSGVTGDHIFNEDIEDVHRYRPGGYHPIHIDDRLNERYRIVEKLGHGGYSTVWLALDEQTTKYVAVKVGVSDADRVEIDVLSHLAQSPLSDTISETNRLLIPPVLDHFEISGPNGTHLCLVTPPARCSLREVKRELCSGFFQLDIARSLAAQLVMALSLLHKRGYAHGDLSLGNLLLQLPLSLDDLSIEQLYECYGEPVKESINWLDPRRASAYPSAPSYVVTPILFDRSRITLGEAMLTLSDFGVAFRPEDKSRFASYTPIMLRPPEAYHDPEMPLTFASDIWSLGCVIFELLAIGSLIQLMMPDPDEVIAEQIDLLGPMPPAWWEKWEARSDWFDENSQLLNGLWSPEALKGRFEWSVQRPRREKESDTLAEDELDAVLSLFKRMLTWSPGDRADVSEVLSSTWMTKWALPAYHECLEARKDLEGQNGLDKHEGSEGHGALSL
ncbi:hypothetical protein E4U56_008319 [Claviceps arundinis]|uniref:non-specific serine/threonine protein kinase n=1 Tax=Claviceps arundinis TaxID=1623583 RepID=A0A9P7MSN6_9HYPO|nr:hypothetical protein E4U56_008319 [Claviceps arundinis]